MELNTTLTYDDIKPTPRMYVYDKKFYITII